MKLQESNEKHLISLRKSKYFERNDKTPWMTRMKSKWFNSGNDVGSDFSFYLQNLLFVRIPNKLSKKWWFTKYKLISTYFKIWIMEDGRYSIMVWKRDCNCLCAFAGSTGSWNQDRTYAFIMSCCCYCCSFYSALLNFLT